MSNNIIIRIAIFCLVILLLITPQKVQAQDNINYKTLTRSLLSIDGNETSDTELYYLACTIRTHLEHGYTNINNVYPSSIFMPTDEQIDIVRSVVNDNTNKCHDVYIAIPTVLLDIYNDVTAYDLVKLIAGDIAFVDYDTFITITVQPNL